jgi:hypothetical protein
LERGDVVDGSQMIFEFAIPSLLGHFPCTMTTSIELPFAKTTQARRHHELTPDSIELDSLTV